MLFFVIKILIVNKKEYIYALQIKALNTIFVIFHIFKMSFISKIVLNHYKIISYFLNLVPNQIKLHKLKQKK